MMNRRAIRITAILLALIATSAALLGYDALDERQRIPPVYRQTTLDV